KQLPAGTYTISQVNNASSNLLQISSNEQTSKGAVVMATLNDYSKGEPKLVFLHNSDEYKLQSISTGEGEYKMPLKRNRAGDSQQAKAATETVVIAALR
ncbi:MAG: hypothetical protein JOZ43_08105, partial [Acidobacteriales bacterium]|nr:hypothetical protein [Terriglobales bacterium]